MWTVWLVFCDCGFHSVCPLMDKRLMEASWWERLRGKLGLVLMGRAMLSKSLIQFSVYWLYSLCCLTWAQTVVLVMKAVAISFKRPHAHTTALSVLSLQQATADPRLHWRVLDTHGRVRVIFLWGRCSFLLGPGVHRLLFVPSESLFPQSCVSSGGSMLV